MARQPDDGSRDVPPEDDPVGRALLQVGKGLSNLFLEDGEEVLEEGLDQLAGGDQSFVDVAGAVGAGFRAGGGPEQLRDQLRRYHDRAGDRDTLPVALHTNPIESIDEEIVGLRVVCSDPDASIWTSTEGVLVESSSGDTTRIDTPFEPAGYTTESVDGVSEWVVRASAGDDRDVIDDVLDEYDGVRAVASAGDQEAVQFLVSSVIQRSDDLEDDDRDDVREEVLSRLNVDAGELVSAHPEPTDENEDDNSEESSNNKSSPEKPGTTDANPGGSVDNSDSNGSENGGDGDDG